VQWLVWAVVPRAGRCCFLTFFTYLNSPVVPQAGRGYVLTFFTYLNSPVVPRAGRRYTAAFFFRVMMSSYGSSI